MLESGRLRSDVFGLLLAVQGGKPFLSEIKISDSPITSFTAGDAELIFISLRKGIHIGLRRALGQRHEDRGGRDD